MSRRNTYTLLMLCLLLPINANALAKESSLPLSGTPSKDTSTGYQHRLPQDEVIYFVLPDRFSNGDPSNDRGHIQGDKFSHGFDPSHKGFYQGGDFAGLSQRLDYLQALGITAIWFAPIFKNKAVQGVAPYISAGYHGYWIQDFTQPDPHFGSAKEFKAFVDQAHKRDMKVIMDIVTNHTADIIQYRECHDANRQEEKVEGCPYRNISDYPYTKQKTGKAINSAFISDQYPHQTLHNFNSLEHMDYAYTPYIRDNSELKVPHWLNDLRYYHHRGDSTFKGESSLYGDFAGLDDIFTEHPRVVEGFIEIYQQWITQFNIDGFRIDTVKHVNPEFWQQFVPAILQHAKSEGKTNFYLFAEVYDFTPAKLAKFTRIDKLPAVLDFALQGTIRDIASGKKPPSELGKLLQQDPLYLDAHQLPTFISNHDMGRIGHFLYKDIPTLNKQEALKRSILAHSLLILSRGVPVIYSGDEQGFTGDGNDQDAREPLFPSLVASYNDNLLIGTNKTTADNNFDTQHPLFTAIAKLNILHQQEKSLRRGKQEILYASGVAGPLVFSRTIDNETIFVFINTSNQKSTFSMNIETSNGFTSLLGDCPNRGGEVDVSIKSLGVAICKAE